MAPEASKSVDESINSDATFCIYCKSRYEYSYRVYGHLGGFKCPNCGYEHPSTLITCTNIDELTSSYSRISFSIPQPEINKFKINDEFQSIAIKENECCENDIQNNISQLNYSAKINLPGLYNIYNSLGAFACGHLLNLPVENSIKAMDSFECGFGRMETINTDGKSIRVILVKNPTGFNQVLNFLFTEDKNFQLAFLINDKIADGTDISWLWDVDFEKLQSVQGNIDNIYTSGLRAQDMSVRLKYAGIYSDKIDIEMNYGELIKKALSRTEAGHNFYILPTYTAMLEIRKHLKLKFGLKEFWK